VRLIYAPNLKQRILVIGCSGAGKSTLSRALGQRLALPIIHLDRAYWRAGWRSIPDEDFASAVDELIKADRWVMDGNFARTMEVRLQRADTVVYLDFPRWRCLWRVTKRVLLWHCRSSPMRLDMSDGCPEKWDWEFIEWVWNFRHVQHQQTVAALARHAARIRVVILRTPADVRDFLRTTSPDSQSPPPPPAPAPATRESSPPPAARSAPPASPPHQKGTSHSG
jgi:adenylate kinase family enzyme